MRGHLRTSIEVIEVSYRLKVNRNLFTLIIFVVTAGSTYLTDLIPIPEIKGFAVAVLAALVAYLATEKETMPNGKTEEKTQTTPS